MAQSSGVGPIIKWGALAVGAWWIYENYFVGSHVAVAATPFIAIDPNTANPAPNPNAIVGANAADGVYSKLIAAAKAPAAGLSVDQWNFFLAQAAPQLGTLPDPMDVFGKVAGFERSQVITGAQYWALMAPYLKDHNGLAGLGFFGGLGALYWGRR